MHDAVIVGAGPGGSATAHFLARRGVDVLLLDRSEFPRDKTCGDGLTPRALRVLDEMGILPTVQQHGCPVGGYEVVAPNGRATSATITSEHGALVVPRQELDEIVLRRAVASGARFEGRVNVSHVEAAPGGARVHAQGGRAFDGRMAVIATGASFGVLTHSGMLPRPPRAMLAARAYFEDLQSEVASTFSLRFDGVPLPGYGWVFPVRKYAANIGVGFFPRSGRRPTRTPTQAFDDFVNRQSLRTLLAGAHQAGPVKGYPIRVDFLTAPTFGDHTLLVGEAAGLVNPLTGEGIDYALESGKLAADHLAESFELGDFSSQRLLDYDHLLRSRFEKIFRFSTLVRDWYCVPPLLNALVPLANRQPGLRQVLASIVLGEREPAGYGPLTMLGRLAVYLIRHR